MKIREELNVNHGLVSLLDMLKFNAEAFYNISLWAEEMRHHVFHHKHNYVDRHLFAEIENCITAMRACCEQIDLKFSLKYINQTEDLLRKHKDSNEPIPKEWAVDWFQAINQRITDELESLSFFHIPTEKVEFYENSMEKFGQQVSTVFPDAIFDIDESGKCFGTQRNTACVFHLMRIMEVGLRFLAEKLNIPATIPTWDGILKKIDAELQKEKKDKSQEWLGLESVIAEAASHLRAVKTAWRNPTMHIEKKYTDEEALDIYSAVRGFMRHLATKLKE